MVSHALSSRIIAPVRLQTLVARLRGRLSVVNPTRATRLPSGLGAAVTGLVRSGFDGRMLTSFDRWEPVGLRPEAQAPAPVRRMMDSRTLFEMRMASELLARFTPSERERSSGGWSWAAIALYESAPVVRLNRERSGSPSAGPPNAAGVATVAYRLLIVRGRGQPGEWAAIDAAAAVAPAVSWPIRRRPRRASEDASAGAPPIAWFVVPLLVPDPWFCAHADAETLAHWARLTGRAGTKDRYWFPETWDRFLEPGRRVGWLTANDVWRPRRGTLGSSARARADVDDWDEGAASAGVGASLTLTPDLERGVGVPPGYALVECVGTLSISIATLQD
jgi:hypothetical protein